MAGRFSGSAEKRPKNGGRKLHSPKAGQRKREGLIVRKDRNEIGKRRKYLKKTKRKKERDKVLVQRERSRNERSTKTWEKG